MSPSFVNDKSHPVRVKDEDGTERRIVPGRVVEAEGKFADNLSAAGLSTATDEDARSWENESARRSGGVTDGPATRLAAKLALGPIRVLGRVAVAAPLRRVVGDDSAPLGPPSGTISTKAAEAAKDDRSREAFADFEALPGESIEHAGTPNPSLPVGATVSSEEIHNAQVANAEQAEDVAQMLNERAAELDVEAQFKPGEPSGSSSTPAGESNDGAPLPEGLPDDYDDLNAAQAEEVVAGLTGEQREQALEYERSHKDRAFAHAE